jgi:hypothetical protein
MKKEGAILISIIFFIFFLININALSIGGDSGGFHNGTIDEVRIYNRSLSAEEIKNHYQFGNYYLNWSAWISQSLLSDMTPVRTAITKFMQFRILFRTNDTDVSPRVLNYSVKSIGTNILPGTLLVKVNSTLGNNYTDENIKCYVNVTDFDNANVYINFTWYNDTGSVLSGQYGPFARNTLTLISTLTSGNTSKYENWTCSVKAYDGTDYEPNYHNASMQILNKPPEVTLISPAHNTQTTNRTPTFNWSGTDADGDSITYELNVSCYHEAGGTCASDDRSFIALVNSSKTIEEYLRYLWDNQYYYNWSVRANDSESYGAQATPLWALKIQSAIATSLPVSSADFGSMSVGDTNSTADNNPPPLEFQNDGNAIVNTTVNATNLWVQASNPSSYYQYKIDNKTGEEGAFVWKWSNISWSKMPLISSLAIARLDWNDSKDIVEFDLNITVPSAETSGSKTSTIWFTSGLGE